MVHQSRDGTASRTLDLRQSRCPANCVEAMAVLEEAVEGAVIEFRIASDTVLDIPRMLAESGHRVDAVRQEGEAGIAIVVTRRFDRPRDAGGG